MRRETPGRHQCKERKGITVKRKLTASLTGFVMLALLLSGCGGSPPAPSSSGAQEEKKPAGLSVTVVNSSGYMFNELYVSATDSYEWGDDLLGSTSVLKKGGSYDITLPAHDSGSYDIRVVDEDDEIYLFEQVPLKNRCTVDIVWEDELGAWVSYGQGEDAYVAGYVEDRSAYDRDDDTDDQKSVEYEIIGVFEEPLGYSFGFDLYNDTSFGIAAVYLVPGSVYYEVNEYGNPDDFDILYGLGWGEFLPEETISVRGIINEAYMHEEQWYLVVKDVYDEITQDDRMQISGQPDEWKEIYIMYDEGYLYSVWG